MLTVQKSMEYLGCEVRQLGPDRLGPAVRHHHPVPVQLGPQVPVVRLHTPVQD